MTAMITWAESDGAAFLIEVGAQSLVLFILAFGTARLLRRSPAWSRHALWTGAFLALLLLPFGHGFLPRFGILPILDKAAVAGEEGPAVDLSKSTMFAERGAGNDAPSFLPQLAPTEPDRSESSAHENRTTEVDPVPRLTGEGSESAETTAVATTWRTPLLLLWGLGYLFFIARFLSATWRIRRWQREATEAGPGLHTLAARVCRSVGLPAAARVVMTDRVQGPALAGIWKPTFLLPHAVARQESEGVIHSLLLHEAMHIKQRDPLIQTCVTLICSVFWFNPLVFLGARHLGREREVLTDAAVVRRLDRSSDYAQGIVEVMKSKNKKRNLSLALGVADGSSRDIEDRLELIIAGGGRAWNEPTRFGRFISIVTMVLLAVAAMSIGLDQTAADSWKVTHSSGANATDAPQDVLLVVDLPEPVPAGGQTAMIDWPSWRRARAGSYVFEGRPMSLEKLAENLAAYGVKKKGMQEDRQPGVSKTTLHLRVHQDRPYQDIARVLMIAASSNVAIYKIDLAQSGSPEKRFPLALPVDPGVNNKTAPIPVTLSVATVVEDGASHLRIAVNGERLPKMLDQELLFEQLGKIVRRRSPAKGTTYVFQVDNQVRFGVLAGILASIPQDDRTTIGFGKQGAIEEAADLPIGQPEIEEHEFLDPREAAEQIQKSIETGLSWLSQQQSEDGSISASTTKDAGLELGRTGLATLAFLGFGHTHRNGPHKDVVAKALDRLSAQLRHPDPKYPGCLAPRHSSYRNYGHAIATLALAEAYNLTQDPTLKTKVEAGIKYILQAQNPYRGWRYGVCDGQNDTSMTTWMLMALKAGKKAGVTIDKRHFDWALDYIRSVTDEDTGRTGYIRKGELSVRDPDFVELYPAKNSEALTAMALTIKSMLDPEAYWKKINQLGLRLLSAKYPRWQKQPGSFDYLYGFFGAMAVNSKDVPFKGTWHSVLMSTLVEHQVKKGDLAGSWPTKSPWGKSGGPVYTTAAALLSLEIAAGIR